MKLMKHKMNRRTVLTEGNAIAILSAMDYLEEVKQNRMFHLRPRPKGHPGVGRWVRKALDNNVKAARERYRALIRRSRLLVD